MELWTLIGAPVVPRAIGELLLTGDGTALTGVLFTDEQDRRAERPRRVSESMRDDDAAVFAAAAAQLGEYFAGERTTFELPLRPMGTPFQLRVWSGLQAIPYGATTSYGALAQAIGLDATASRAVGLANGANPISIIVPCHRVIGANGALTGYGGGLDRKRFLLDLERGSLF